MKYLVLGGGTAGWFTALFIKQIFPKSDVTLIQSKEIGIIGVGEATTPNIMGFLNILNINALDLMKECDCSVKNGISFENWNGDGKKYFHTFKESVLDFTVPNIFTFDCYNFYLKKLINNNLPLEEYLYQTKLAYANKIDLHRTDWSIHFNANKMADYLEKVGKERGITVVDGIYKSAEQDEKGFIKKIILEDDAKFDCDFVFDCTGFHRLLIGKLYKQKWISYSKHLPMKKAIPFWIDSEEDKVNSYTTCTAMKYGWIWKIPLQSRIGSGYVFDSDYIDENQALLEAEEFYRRKLEIRKIIDFDAGKYENFWVKNCMAVGLSSSFIEPLESTSLFLTVGQLNLFRQFLNEIKEPNEKSVKLFNEIVSNNMEDTMNFVYLHYMTKRNDSKFWQEFREKNVMPEKLQNMFENIKSGNLRYFDATDTRTPTNFTLSSYLQVCHGLELFENGLRNENYENVDPSPAEYKFIIDEMVEECPYHKDFLEKTL